MYRKNFNVDLYVHSSGGDQGNSWERGWMIDN